MPWSNPILVLVTVAVIWWLGDVIAATAWYQALYKRIEKWNRDQPL